MSDDGPGDQGAGESGSQEDQGDVVPASVSFWTILASTLAAAVGVQSRANRERDFQHGTSGAFIAAGVIFTVVFVVVLVVVVRLVIGLASS